MTAERRPTSSPHDVRRFLLLRHEQGDVFEVRIPNYGKYKLTAAGYFDNVEAAFASSVPRDGRANIYTTVNPVNPALLARAAKAAVRLLRVGNAQPPEQGGPPGGAQSRSRCDAWHAPTYRITEQFVAALPARSPAE